MSLSASRPWLWLAAGFILVAGLWFLFQNTQDSTPNRPKVSEGGLSEFGSLAGSNVLLITLDTTRADRYGCYGNKKIATPTMDQLADEGVLFSRTTAVSPVTLPSHASILTGLYPRQHGVRSNGFYKLDGPHVTMAEVLQGAGYETGAVLAAFVLNERFGLAQGFENYDDDLKETDKIDPLLFAERTATQVTDRALGWLEERSGKSFLLWVHYFDPHSPYRPPVSYLKKHPGQPYDAEIAYLDAEMGRLLAGLARMGYDENTIVVVIGDHGESLREKDEPTHGYLLYEGTMHVPFILKCGGKLGGGIERTDRVSQVDVMPTVLALLGLEPPSGMSGVDLQRAGKESRLYFGETYEGKMEHGWAALYSVYDDDTKYVYGPNPEMYDLAEDPDEQKNISNEQQERVFELHEKLAAHFGEELDSSDAPIPSKQLNADEMVRLRSLGYTVSSPKGAPQKGPGADPRRMMRVMGEVDRIVFGKPPEERGSEEIAALEGVLQKNPDFVPGFRYLGVMRRANGDLEGAIKAFAHAVKLHPDSPDLRLMLAECRGLAGRNQQAIDDLHILLAAHPENAMAHLLCGRLLMVSDMPDSAILSLQIATMLEPDLPGCADTLERAYAKVGRSAELVPFFETMLESYPKSSVLRKAMSVLLHRQGLGHEAEVVLRDGLALAPENPQALNSLVKLLLTSPDAEGVRFAEAAALFAELDDEVIQSDADLMLTMSQVFGVQGKLDKALTACRQALDLAKRSQRNSVAKQARHYLEILEGARAKAESR